MLHESGVKSGTLQPASTRMALSNFNKMCTTSTQESISDMSWDNPLNCWNESPQLQLAKQIMTQISDLPLDTIDSDSVVLRCQGMQLTEDLSKVESFFWAREKLLHICIASIFALPPVDTLQRKAEEKVGVQALYDQIEQALQTTLKCLLSERPSTNDLLVLLNHLAPWMTSEQEHERARAVSAYISLLECAATDPTLYMSDEFHKLGLLIGQLCLRIFDSDMTIGSQAMKGIYFLYSIIQHQKDINMEVESLDAEQYEIYKGKLGTYVPLNPGQNVSQIIKEFEPFLTSRQMTELLLTAIGCLKESNRKTMVASYTITHVILEEYKHHLSKQIPEIVDKIYLQLGSIYHYQNRQIVMKVMCSLAHTYMQEVCNALLQCCFPIDRFATEMWYVLTKECSYDELTELMNILLKNLQTNPRTTGDYIAPLITASAFRRVLAVPKCSHVALYIYPRLLLTLLVQVHYSIRHQVRRNSVYQEELNPVSFLVKALKTLLLAVKCFFESAFEKERGWELLTSSEDHHRGVGLFARVLIQNSYHYDLLRILYLLVPFLERGDEEHQITAMAFFVELLVMSEAKRLPDLYCLNRLKEGLDNKNTVIRALCIRGLVNMADWPRKDIKILLPAMTQGLSGMNGKLFLESVTEIEKILTGPESADSIYNITLYLQELFDDNCKYTLDESTQFLGWKLPKQVVCEKAWYEHEEVLDEICQYLVQKHQGTLQRFLYQSLFYTASPLLPIRRASIMFLGFLILHMDSKAQKVDLDVINHALEVLLHDNDESVCLAAAHAHERVFAVLSQQLNGSDGKCKPVASDTNEKQIRNVRPQSATSIRSNSSNLLSIICLWKSANKK
ncbi:probable proline--tRNA ligase, mitochondrial isoform X4 [Hemicordylus capensis]|uniref:probable proline--tRNA ligase, mitochondrial isoform X4 n=1 Tax=Hemicordylus capensis TaxID=884348 RepID=UPI002304CBE3|nr:probable proline--tRNA ligase, mitochondrial isoform X4 [Hemicordylus capensis]